jgi:flagellar biosynthetic protein FlhB
MSAAGQDQNEQDKSEAPSPRKLRRAREKGDIPRSQELAAAFAMVVGLWIFTAAGGAYWGAATVSLLTDTLAGPPGEAWDPGAVAVRGQGALRRFGAILLPPLVAIALGLLVLNGIQAGGTLTAEKLKWKWDNLNPVSGAKKIFKVTALVELLKTAAKITVLLVAAWLVIRSRWTGWVRLPTQGPQALVAALREVTLALILYVGLLFGAVAGLDYAWQRWQWYKQLRMTRNEVKREHKEEEGDPMQQAERRRRALALARSQTFAAVPDADLLVTNPTHIAVALRYQPDVADAPLVTAMGVDLVAEEMKRIAREARVPCIENVGVARALHAGTRVGEQIPPVLYSTVLRLLDYAYSLRGRSLPMPGDGAPPAPDPS